MKRIWVLVSIVFFMVAFSETATASRCATGYMNDPCSVDGYGIVQTERYAHSRHNHMVDIHRFTLAQPAVKKGKRVVYKKRTHRKRLYKTVKRCRLVRVPR